MRYWQGDPAFEVPCPKCGSAVEIFKDESKGRCTECGHGFQNPKSDLACAKWCAYAEQCLGFAPKREVSANLGEGALASRLIQAVKEELEGDQARIARALVVFQHAKDLTWKEGGDPRVTLAAALLLEVGVVEPAARTTGQSEDPARVRTILAETGLDEETIDRVCRVIGAHRSGENLDAVEFKTAEFKTVEFKIVCDSCRLMNLAAENPAGNPDQLEKTISSELRTTAAKDRARRLFRA